MSQAVELKSEELWRRAYPLLRSLRPELVESEFLARRADLSASGYRLFGLMVDDKLVCAAGVLLHPHLSRGREFWIHDLATAEAERSKGYATMLINLLKAEAKAAGCSRIVVHTRVERARAQNFYEKHVGFEKYAVVYQKLL